MNRLLGMSLVAALGAAACEPVEGEALGTDESALTEKGRLEPVDVWRKMNEASYHLKEANRALHELTGGAYFDPTSLGAYASGGAYINPNEAGAYFDPSLGGAYFDPRVGGAYVNPSAGGAYIHFSHDELVNSHTIDPTGRLYRNDYDALLGRGADGLAAGAYAIGFLDEMLVAGAYSDVLHEQLERLAGGK